MRRHLLLTGMVFGLASGAFLRAAEGEPVSQFTTVSSAHAGTLFDVGDAPTAYTAARYELRADMRLFEGGGVFTRGYFGIFPWLTLGGAAAVGNVIGSGPVLVDGNDAKALFKVRLLEENENRPGLALGWDGPAYGRGRLRGLYLAVSKEFQAGLGLVEVHGGVNSSANLQELNGEQVSGFAAVSAEVEGWTLFTEYDDMARPGGGSWNAGLRYTVDPVVIGVEFKGMASDTPTYRILRLGFEGQF